MAGWHTLKGRGWGKHHALSGRATQQPTTDRPLGYCKPTMRILAIETTDKTGTIAAADGSNLLAEMELDRSQRSAQSLVPGLHRLLESVGWQPGDVQLVAVTVGPGSFTGLRVGIATAKVLAYAVGAEILGIDTLETIAAAVPYEVDAVCTVLDAQRGEVSVAALSEEKTASSSRSGRPDCWKLTLGWAVSHAARW